MLRVLMLLKEAILSSGVYHQTGQLTTHHPPSPAGASLMLTLTRSPSIQYTHLTYEVSFRITYHLQLNCRRFFTITLQFYILSTHRLHTRLSAPPRRLFFRCEATTLNFQNICVICYLFKEKDVCHPKYVVTSVLATAEMAPADLPTQRQWRSCSGL